MQSNIAGWKMDPLKMYFLLNMVIFHCYISLPEGNMLKLQTCTLQNKKIVDAMGFHMFQVPGPFVFWGVNLRNDLKPRSW